MPIVMVCSGCSARMNAPATAGGRRARCPRCGALMRVPEPGWAPPTVEMPAAAPGRSGMTATRILGVLAGGVLGFALAVGGAWWALRRAGAPGPPQEPARAVVAEVAEEGRSVFLVGGPVTLARHRSRDGVDHAPPEVDGDLRLAPGDRVVLLDEMTEGRPDVILAADLDALRAVHLRGTVDGPARFRPLARAGRIFSAPAGSVARVADVVHGNLPLGIKSVEVELGDGGDHAWVTEPYLR